MESQYFKITAIHVEHAAHHFLQINCVFPAVDHLHASRDHVKILENTIGKLCPKSRCHVLAGDHQSRNLILRAEGCRKPFQFLFPLIDLVAFIYQKCGAMSPLRPNAETAFAKIANSMG